MTDAVDLIAFGSECIVCGHEVPAVYDLVTGGPPTAAYRWTTLIATPGVFFCSPQCEIVYDAEHKEVNHNVRCLADGEIVVADRRPRQVSATTGRRQRKLYGLARYMPMLRSEPDGDAGDDTNAPVRDD